jgi:hypothetical protein
MRNPVAETKLIVASMAVLALCSAAVAQDAPQARGGGRGSRGPQAGFVAAGIPSMPNPPGPAPTHDLSGVWVGPIKVVIGPFPTMTPAGQAAFKLNHPIASASDRGVSQVQANNDPFAICDPLAFPRDLENHALSWRGGIWFSPAAGSDRMLILFEQQRSWREVWMDGRQLPAKFDAPGAPESRYYGYSVGHWDGDHTLVIDTTGLDPSSWLEEHGQPHSDAAKIQERWTRFDQYNIEATVTVNDPKFYTKPFQLLDLAYYWKKDQDMEEELCLPSSALEYSGRLSSPSGWGPGGNTQH